MIVGADLVPAATGTSQTESGKTGIAVGTRAGMLVIGIVTVDGTLNCALLGPAELMLLSDLLLKHHDTLCARVEQASAGRAH